MPAERERGSISGALVTALLGGLLAVGAGGCSDDDDRRPPPTTAPPTQPQEPVLAVELVGTAPPIVGLREALVTIDRVTLAPEPPSAEEVVLLDSPRTIDLLDLRGGETATLFGGPFPPGDFRELRLRIRDVDLVRVRDGLPPERLASRERGVVSARGPFPIVAAAPLPDPPLARPGRTEELLVDLDLATFAEERTGLGGVRQVVIDPLVRAAFPVQGGRITGRIRGAGSLEPGFPRGPFDPIDPAIPPRGPAIPDLPRAGPDLPRTGVVLFDEGGTVPVARADVDEEGEFVLDAVPPGVFRLEVVRDGLPVRQVREIRLFRGRSIRINDADLSLAGP